MEICLVVRGNTRWYCPPEQTEYWAAQGCTVFELTPTRVAGPDTEADELGVGPVSAEGSGEPLTEDKGTAPVPLVIQGGNDE